VTDAMEPQNKPDAPIQDDSRFSDTSFYQRWSGLKDRVVSGSIMAVVALALILLGGWVFTAAIIIAGLQMMREWDGLTTRETNIRWRLSGIAYATIPCACMIWLRESGSAPVLFVILVVAATDIGAYFTGREIGGPKLAPTISPGKTWSGLGGGMIAAALVATICSSFSPYPSSAPVAFILGGTLAAIAQGGDLFESWLKRRVGVKDSSNLIPGHGGLLDRVDGLVAALPVYTLLFWIAGNLS
jgi:phosphatidate cytidylyltransferase